MFSNAAQMPGPAVPARKKNRVRDAAALAAGGGVAVAGVGIHGAARQIGRAAREAGDAVATVNKTTRAGGRFLKGARKQLTTFPTFRKIVKKLLSKEQPTELGIFRKPGTSVSQDRYRKQIDERERDRATSNYAKSALAGALAGGLHRGKKGAVVGAVAGVAAQAGVRAVTARGKDSFGERSHDGKVAEKVPALAGVAAAGVLASKKARGQVGSVIKKGVRKVRGIKLAASDELTAAQKIGKALKKKWASAPDAVRAGALGAGALGGAGALAGAAAPDKGESRTQSAVGHAAKDGVFGAALYGATEPFLKKKLGVDAEGAIKKVAKKVLASDARRPVFLSGRLGSRLLELRASHHSDKEGRDGGGKFKDSIAGYIDKDKNYQDRTLKVSDAPVVRSALRKASTINKVATRGGRLASDAVGHLQGKKKVDERGRPLKREWEKSYFKKGVKDVAIGAGVLGGAAYLRSHPKTTKEIRAVKAHVTGNTTVRKRSKATGKMYDSKISPPTGKIGKGIVKGADKLKSGVKKAVRGAKKLFTARLRDRLIQLDYYSRKDWDLRDPRGKSARVFAPGSQVRTRRPKKFHEKASNQRKIGAAVAAAGTVAGFVAGRRSAIKSVEKKAASTLAKVPRRAAPNKGMMKVRHDGQSFFAPRPKKK